MRTGKSTQEQNPGKAVLRTIVEVGIPAFVGLVLILPPILQEVASSELLDGIPGLRGWLLAAAGVITGVAALFARIMAIPGVAEWFRKHIKPLAPDDDI